MRLDELDYVLPPERIAQRPLVRRDASRMLVLHRGEGRWEDRIFADLPEILRGDEVLVVNDAKVIPARLFGHRMGVHAQPPSRATRKEHLSGAVEVLLIRQIGDETWEALVRPGRKIGVGERIVFGAGEMVGEVIARGEFGVRKLRFVSMGSLRVPEFLERYGHVPLPPYIARCDEPADRERYQTLYAKRPGAVAAPTAGLHFTPEILEKLRWKGIEICELTLDVGLGTFQPIHAETLENHVMHSESYEISQETAKRIAKARQSGRPILAVGTTVVRALEDSALRADAEGLRDPVLAGKGEARLFITPGFRFRVVDQLLTNFHLPRSTLLALVCAFAGTQEVLGAYRHAVEEKYRFYSFGDCMLIR
jgi:S-adenosylmethionine:tRNA ribosyltransferase-isomerase